MNHNPPKNYLCTRDMTEEEKSEYGRKGGKASAEAKRKRKTLKAELLALLSEGDVQERMSLQLISKVLEGGRDAVRAFEVIRSTIGEDAVQKIEQEVKTTTITVSVEDEDKPKTN